MKLNLTKIRPKCTKNAVKSFETCVERYLDIVLRYLVAPSLILLLLLSVYKELEIKSMLTAVHKFAVTQEVGMIFQ